MAETNIVAGLFGMNPQMYERQQYQQDLQQGYDLARLDPGAAARAQLAAGIGQLGRGFAGAMGIEDPQLKMISQTNQLMQGLDLRDPKSLEQAAVQANQMGNTQLAFKLLEAADNAQIRLQQAQVREQQAQTQRQTSLAQLVAQQAYRSGTPERPQMLDIQEQQQMADQGTPMPENIAAVAPSYDIRRVAPQLQLLGAPGFAQLKAASEAAKAMRPETFDLSEGQIRYGYDSQGEPIKIAGTEKLKEKPQPTFGTEAERISKEQYGKRYNDLNPAEAAIVNRKVEVAELAKVPKTVVDVRDPTAVGKASLDVMNKWEGFLKASGDIELANRYANLQSSIELARKGNPSADGASLYNLAKIYDPSGAVQEGDKKSILGNASIPERVKLLAQQFYAGGSFTPTQRNNILLIAKEIKDQRNTQLERYRKEYVNVITKFGGSSDSIFNPYSMNQNQLNLSSVINAPPSN